MKRKLDPNLWTAVAAALIATSMAACSSSPSAEKAGEDVADLGDEIPDLEAGTDAVPGGDLEQIENIEGLPSGSLAEESNDPAAETPAAETPPAEELADATPPPADPMTTASTTPEESTPPPFSEPLAESPAPPAEAAAPAAWTTADSGGENTFSGSSGNTETYTVQAGDTLMKIAFDTYGDLYQWRKIYDMNQDRIQDPNRIPPGTTLQLERPASPVQVSRNGERYLIKMGDTLGTISDDIYGTTAKWRQLWENNRELIKDPNRIFAGFHLYYTITAEEQEEADRLKQMRQAPASPLATGGEFEDRGPASATAPAAVVPVTPGT